MHLQACEGERCWRNSRLPDGSDDPDEEGDGKEGGAGVEPVQPAGAEVAQGAHSGAGQQEPPGTESAHVSTHDWGENEGGDEDAAQDDPGLGDGDALGEGLPGVEGGQEGERDASKEVGEADQAEVQHSSPSHLFTVLVRCWITLQPLEMKLLKRSVSTKIVECDTCSGGG